MFGIEIDCVRMEDAVTTVLGWCMADEPAPCRNVVTPNVNHIVLLESDALFRAAYRSAALVLADGWPIVAASCLAGARLPERVAGSDLIPAVFDASRELHDLRVYLLGGKSGVADRAANRIHRRWPHVRVVGISAPPLGFEHDDLLNRRILCDIAATKPQLLVIGLGAPKQELWLHKVQSALAARVAVAAGATIDFLAGEQNRAPSLVQQLRIEWLYRIATDPRRLMKRYLHDAIKFPQIVVRDVRLRSSTASPIE